MPEEFIEIFDDKNNLVGKEKRSVVHSKGLLHRTVNILIVNSEGKIFLQQRSASKDVCPLKWDISAAEHLNPGE
jgi:isopentenyldiphosphate isomerase